MPSEYPPYVNGYGGIPKLFTKIREAAVPPKFTQDFVSTILGLKSSSYRAMIPLMKRLGFVDPSNVPTQAYKDLRDPDPVVRGAVVAEHLRGAYKSLFSAHEYAYKLEKKVLEGKLRSLLGAAEDDANIGYVASTFLELAKLANWETSPPRAKNDSPSPDEVSGANEEEIKLPERGRETGSLRTTRLGLSYTIYLNLPATTEIEVFNAIFKSLRENLLRES